MQTAYTLSEEVSNRFLQLFEYQHPAEFKENLRRMFIDFLEDQLRTGLPFYLDDFFYPFNTLLDILDKAGKDIDAFKHEEGQPLPATAKEQVIGFIKGSINPEKIYLLAEYNDEQGKEYFDLLVVIPETTQTAFSHYEQVISMASIDNAVINVSLHKSASLQQQLEAGHIFYSLACTSQNLVYDDGKTAFPALKPGMLKTKAATASHEFEVAHQRAENFLEGASDYYRRHEEAMATFMLQQAVELDIRGLVKALSGNCPKTHCFAELKKPLRRYVPELWYLLSEDEAEENRLLRILEKAYLEARYSEHFNISDNDFTLITEATKKLHERTEEIFRRKIAMLNAETNRENKEAHC